MYHKHEYRKLFAINSDFFGLLEYFLFSGPNLGTFTSTTEISFEGLF